ncbi:sulfur oxidation c-type cytochrome SoxX [Roseomonas eburnea]|uniref:Sulfur oxidation c-type cytochrome SoxX n=2 Tax=Neoroseomonas eburnea TaxID=1346889 RepID=A0A9X9XG21_9PROT|nr:sulfur oxidation c-type cytochrome SoxX [Neoroseomonas eburnea]MBR0682657.1 sulfur oxidation c-type cytochrome SoxX [Neoroseomonas eburnea]
MAAATPAWAQTAPAVPFTVVDDAIPQPLTLTPGDATRGRALALDRSKGNCVTCHELPLRADFQGDLGPPLAGVADRYSIGELRLRVVDSKRINPESNMPSYHRIDGLTAVRSDWAGRPILTAQEVEDVLAYLMTLR